MKLVDEHINEFKRGKDSQETLSLGKHSIEEKTKVYNYLENSLELGFWYSYNSVQEDPQTVFIDNIYEIQKDIDILLNIGVDISLCTIYYRPRNESKYSIEIPAYNITDGSHIYLTTVFVKEARLLINIMKDLNISGVGYKIDTV